MSYRYAVIGAGRQGIAAAYDMAKFGNAESVLLADTNLKLAQAGAKHINQLLKRNVAKAVRCDVRNKPQTLSVLKGVDSFLSGVPYPFNPVLTDIAIKIKANMCDLGGNTAIVRQQLKKDTLARKAGISIVPDCGMGPGLNISLAVYAMSLVDNPKEVYIWDGGLPQNPQPPWNYLSTFNIGGLTNEYYGDAYFLRDGKVTPVPCFEGEEELDFPPPIGRLEAAVTSGGLSTAPWTFQGKLQRLENKTLRYPGHWSQFKAFALLGLLELKPIQVGKIKIVPRDVLHALLEPKITRPHIKDVCVMRVKCVGAKNGRPAEAMLELIDYYDEITGFTAMQRLTGWHASIVAILAARGAIKRGAVSVESVPGDVIVKEARLRGFEIKEKTVIG